MSIGLLASLLPRTSLISHSRTEIVDAVGPVWPEASVEQVIDPWPSTISEVRIWAAAQFERGEAPVVAALLQGPDREIVRQFYVKIHATKTLQPYVLWFEPYEPIAGEELILQLWVSNERSNYAIFGTTDQRSDRTGPTLNLNPTSHGSLAYEMIWRGDGWRAALDGSPPEALRLAGGIAAGVLAALLQPRILRALRKLARKAGAAMRFAVSPIDGALRRAWRGLAAHRPRTTPPSSGRSLYVFPWLIPAFAVLHYLANNLTLVRAYEAITISVIIMAAVTVLFVACRFLLKSTPAAAAFTGLLGIAFFAYGHVYVDQPSADHRLLFGLGIPLVLGIAMLLRGRTVITPPVRRFLNLGSVVLLALPIAQLALVALSAVSSESPNRGTASPNNIGLDQRIQDARASTPPEELRDIYFIILDEYPRSGSPPTFDNTEFIQKMESRGFYVDPYARSNYPRSRWSITSALNMEYIDLYDSSQATAVQLFKRASNHLLGRVARDLGYTYVHVSSGWSLTSTNPQADLVVSFGPSGRIVSGYVDEDPCIFERIVDLTNVFTTGFLQTTIVKEFVSADPLFHTDACAYFWKHPSHALEWLEFMKDSASIDGPKFVFAHFLKPHSPFSFDRHGNIAPGSGWSDDHDPTVESAFYGQLLWVNDRLIEVVDAILADSEEQPIIVIMGDHGSRNSGYEHPMATDIFAAYLLPDGHSELIYPSITPVNIFRVLLNHYFALDFELLEDKVYRFWE